MTLQKTLSMFAACAAALLLWGTPISPADGRVYEIDLIHSHYCLL